jgi:hypothetical protein
VKLRGSFSKRIFFFFQKKKVRRGAIKRIFFFFQKKKVRSRFARGRKRGALEFF